MKSDMSVVNEVQIQFGVHVPVFQGRSYPFLWQNTGTRNHRQGFKVESELGFRIGAKYFKV